MAITAQMVKELRERTGLGMMECKKALESTDGDADAAIKVLRERGQMKAEKRADRTAAEGLVALAFTDDMTAGTMAQLNCETDFVSRNDEFAASVKSIAEAGLAAKAKDLDALNAAALNGTTVAALVEDIRTRIGEKIELSTFDYFAGDVVTGYVHFSGKIGVLIAATAPGIAADKKEAVAEGLRGIAMHIAATAPRFLDESQVDQGVLEAEKEIYAQQAKNEGKPDQIIPKIVEGKIKAFYKDNCLVHQPFAQNTDQTIAQVVTELGKAAGAEVKLTGFSRVQVGAK